ncbi:MAG TPA: hypothetical protein VMQ76_12645 [Terracidiphilus sp.]|nr:hypothetical protein [Terracidiphilus sp.]
MNYSGLIGGLLGTGVGAAEGAYLGAPGVSQPNPFNPTTLNLGKSTNDYQKLFGSSFAGASVDANQLNKFDINQALSAYTAMQPQFQAIQSQIGQNALSYSKGQLPSDVVSSIGRAASSQGIQGGYAGGGGPSGSSFAGANAAGTNLDLRNLGMNSLQLSEMGTQLGMQADSQAQALSPVLASPMDFMPSFSQALGVDQYNNELTNSANLSNTASWNNYNQSLLNSSYTGKENMVQSMMEGAQVGSSMCWVAREVLGEDNPEWKAFRSWLITSAPEWLFNLYGAHGKRFSEWLHESACGPFVKAILRPWMKRVALKWRIV